MPGSDVWETGADFSAATVSVSDDSGSVPVEVLARVNAPGVALLIAPEPVIVWAVAGDTDSQPLSAPTDGDHCYTVTVSGVKIAETVTTPYEYAVCVLDPDR